MSHAAAYAVLRATAPEGAGRRATRLAQAVALHETGYGQGWQSCPAMLGSNNWGAIQGQPGHLCGDSHADGSKYQAHYRVYASPEAGAAGLWFELWKRPHVRRVLMDDALDVVSLAQAMKVDRYFEASTSSYIAALKKALARIMAGPLSLGTWRTPSNDSDD